jgi:hypothetical protein
MFSLRGMRGFIVLGCKLENDLLKHKEMVMCIFSASGANLELYFLSKLGIGDIYLCQKF